MQSKNLVRILPAALLALTAATSSPASAYDYNYCFGDRVNWGTSLVLFSPSNASFPAGSAARSALDAAFDAWNIYAPGTRFTFFVDYDDATCRAGDKKNSICFDGSYNWGSSTLAVTLRQSSCGLLPGGDLKEADVLFNPGRPWTYVTNPSSPPLPQSSPYYLTLVGLHELGHAFGLNHQDSAIATLNGTYPNGGTLGNHNSIRPHADDVYGDRAGYGTCCTERDVYASAYQSTGPATTDRIPSPSSAYRGYPVSFPFSIGNRGTTNEGSVRVQYYLSTDRFISTSDTFLGAATFSLSSGRTSTFTASATIPVSQPSGMYYLGWIVDPLGSIPEVDESNNEVALTSSTSVPAYSPPTACGSANPSWGSAPLNVAFDAACSYDPDGSIASYYWDLGDGITSTSASTYRTYGSSGHYTVTLRVTDNQGYISTTNLYVEVTDSGSPPAF